MHSLWWATGERRGLRRRLPALAGGVLLLTLLVVLTSCLSSANCTAAEPLDYGIELTAAAVLGTVEVGPG